MKSVKFSIMKWFASLAVGTLNQSLSSVCYDLSVKVTVLFVESLPKLDRVSNTNQLTK